MAAQSKAAQSKAKPAKATPKKVTKPVKKKPTKTAAKKVTKKPQVPEITEAQFEAYFFKLPPKLFKQMCLEWNEENLKIKITKQQDYDHWLNYFKTLPASHVRLLVTTGQDILDAEAYAALRRWHDIIANPARIDKIHQAGLTNAKNKNDKSIVELAEQNDRLGVLQATRRKIAEKLDKGAGARDTASLTREMTDIMTQIAEYEKRQGPKKSTVLGSLLSDMPQIKERRPARNGGGSRNTSFKSRVTIKDIEDADE